jgi:hypothetical protein
MVWKLREHTLSAGGFVNNGSIRSNGCHAQCRNAVDEAYYSERPIFYPVLFSAERSKSSTPHLGYS